MVDTATKLRRAFIAIPKVFYIVLLVILCILYADLKGRPRTFNSPETDILQRIFQNVHQNPINTISIMGTSGCPTGTTAISLGTWPGTVLGCQCGSTITAGACTSSSCTTISAVSAQHITTWKGDQFCVTRVSSWSTLNGTCASGSVTCSVANMCIPSGETCPITFLQIKANTVTPPSTYTQVLLSNSRILSYSVDEDGSPITDLTVSLFDMPCMDPSAMPYSSSRSPYPLSVIPENGCGGTGLIENLQNVENQGLTALLQENSLTAALSLPSYSTYITNEKAYFVGLRQYQLFNISSSCGDLDPVRFVEAKNDEDYYVSRVYPLIIAAIVVLAVKFATILIELFFRIRKNEEEDHWLNLFVGVNLLILLGVSILFILIGAYGVHAQVQLASNTSYFKSLSRNQCFEQTVVNVIFQVFQGNISNFYAIVWLSITLLIVACSGIIVITVLGIVNHYYGKRTDFKSYYKSVAKIGRKKTPRGQPAKPAANIEMLLAK